MKKFLTVKKQGETGVLFKQDVLDESIVTVGNNPSATLELADGKVAPEQFVIISEKEQMILMNRANGTVINGESLALGTQVELSEGDKIEIGDFQLFLDENEINGSNENIQKEVGFDESLIDQPIAKPNEERDFSTVLNSIREEDSFYFHITDEEDVIERVLFDSEEIWLGTLFDKNSIQKDKEKLDEIYAHVKKDWSGAVIYPDESEEIWLNGVLLTEPKRLKNDDQIILIDDFADDDGNYSKITFHEPVVLLALNSILPEELPEPVTLQPFDDKNINRQKESTEGSDIAKDISNQKADSAKKRKNRIIFGYFSVLEIIIMAIGTLVTAAIIFLVLELI